MGTDVVVCLGAGTHDSRGSLGDDYVILALASIFLLEFLVVVETEIEKCLQ